mmetsp:Transcript_22210/g.53815  ORF Transcript_22210/g.53815 Transcript_22210/m.53815 type:complete len:214 (-) Transcript_22210:544-1185(-)
MCRFTMVTETPYFSLSLRQYCFQFLAFFSNTLEAKRRIQKLNGEQLQRRHGSEPRPYRNESTPQARSSLLPHRPHEAIGHAIVQLFIRGLIHQIGPDTIERGHSHRHEESRQEARAECRLGRVALPSRDVDDVSLRNIVHSHLRGVQRDGPQYVHLDAPVKSRYALIAIHPSHQAQQRRRFALRIRLADGLQHVEGISRDGSHRSRQRSRDKF